MGPITAQLADELGYAGEVRPAVTEVPPLARGMLVAARDGTGRDVVVARLASGRLVVVDDRCPHDGGRISDGFVEGNRIVCARHGFTWQAVAGSAGCRLRRCKHRE